MSAFRTWFKAQFGRVPDARLLSKLRAVEQAQSNALEDTRAAIRSEIALSRAWDTSLYGWNARIHGLPCVVKRIEHRFPKAKKRNG